MILWQQGDTSWPIPSGTGSKIWFHELRPAGHQRMIGWCSMLCFGWPEAVQPGRISLLRFGPHQTVYSRFCKWRDDGTILHIFQELNADADYENLCIDSTSIKAHPQSVGAKGDCKFGKQPVYWCMSWRKDYKNPCSCGCFGKSCPFSAYRWKHLWCPVPPLNCFRKWIFLAATFWAIKHTEQSPFALTSQSREHRIRSHPKVMWLSLGSAISTLIRNATWSSASSINSRFFTGSLHAMISYVGKSNANKIKI